MATKGTEINHLSLAATINSHRPDLATQMAAVDSADAIESSPPPNFFAKYTRNVEGIGEPMHPCFFTTTQTDPTNW